MNEAHVIEGWKRLGATPPTRLVGARLQLHWAAQIMATIGYTFSDPVPDYSHTSLSWMPEAGMLASQEVQGTSPFRMALRPADLSLHLLDQSERSVNTFSLAGNTLEEGYGWLASTLSDLLYPEGVPPLLRPDHEMPAHPVGEGARFYVEEASAFEEMRRWFANAHRLLQEVQETYPEASPVRCWPHHFDLATLLSFDPDKDAEEARSIGVGLSPGDGGYAEPYWYVLPWPPPKASVLPPLPGPGSWHTEGWVGAVMPATQGMAQGVGATQALQALAFVRAAVSQSHKVLELQ